MGVPLEATISGSSFPRFSVLTAIQCVGHTREHCWQPMQSLMLLKSRARDRSGIVHFSVGYWRVTDRVKKCRQATPMDFSTVMIPSQISWKYFTITATSEISYAGSGRLRAAASRLMPHSFCTMCARRAPWSAAAELPPSPLFRYLLLLQRRQQAAALQGLRLHCKKYVVLGVSPAIF
jgi:hypothetical protein